MNVAIDDATAFAFRRLAAKYAGLSGGTQYLAARPAA